MLYIRPKTYPLGIKPLWQRDERWKNRRLGDQSASPDSTIGRYGCLLTCVTMLANYYTEVDDWNPPQVNYLLAKRDGFWNGNLIVYGMIPLVFPEMQFDGFIDCGNYPAPISEIDSLLPVILKVDFNITTAPVEGHFVLAVRKYKNHDYEILDPWTGKQELLLDRYAKPGWDLARAIFRVIKITKGK